MYRTLALFFLLISLTLNAQPKFATTIHPFKAILTELAGDRATVYELLPPSASPHTHELRPSEIRTIAEATALFYGADNLDGWAVRLESANRISLFELLPQQEKQSIKYFVGKKKGEVVGSDPHFWTDPLTVKALLPALVDALCGLDPEGCPIYQTNSIRFAQELDSLYQIIENKLSHLQNKKVLLAHPFFQYYLNRFGVKLIGVVETIPGSEPTPRELKQIIDEANKQQLRLILTHAQIPDRPAEIIAEATGAEICVLDPIGGVAGRETYGELLLYNTRILIEALQ